MHLGFRTILLWPICHLLSFNKSLNALAIIKLIYTKCTFGALAWCRLGIAGNCEQLYNQISTTGHTTTEIGAAIKTAPKNESIY